MFKTGDTVFMPARKNVFHAWDGTTTDEPRKGPFTVDRVYTCGKHTRLSAHGSGLTKIEAAIHLFEPA